MVTSQGQYTYLTTTLDRSEIETWNGYQSVCFVKTHLMICNMTYLCQSVTLTQGQGRRGESNSSDFGHFILNVFLMKFFMCQEKIH